MEEWLETIRIAESTLRTCDVRLGRLMDRVGPCDWHQYRRDPFDCLVWSIVGQQLSTRAADKIEARLRAETDTTVFTPAAIAAIPQQRLRTLGLSGSKVRTLHNLAESVDSGVVSLAALEQQDDDTVRQALCELHGIGPWTAEMFLMFGLNRLDIFSPGDLGLRKAIQFLDDLDSRPDPAFCAERAAVWAPHRTVASWYLWRLVD